MPPTNQNPIMSSEEPVLSQSSTQLQAEQWDNVAYVTYYQNATVFGKLSAALVAKGDQVQLYKVDSTTGQLGEQLLNTTWAEIDSAVMTMNIIKLKTQGSSFRIDFNRALTRAAGEMGLANNPGVFGVAAAIGAQVAVQRDMNQAFDAIEGEQGNNFRWWLQAFEAHGIKVKDSIANQPFKLLGIFFGVIIGLIVLWLVIGSLIVGY